MTADFLELFASGLLVLMFILGLLVIACIFAGAENRAVRAEASCITALSRALDAEDDRDYYRSLLGWTKRGTKPPLEPDDLPGWFVLGTQANPLLLGNGDSARYATLDQLVPKVLP